MPPKVILLTGAPAPSEVTSASSTIGHFDASICKFMGLEPDASHAQTPSSAPFIPPWRVLPLVRQSLPTTTGFSQNHNIPAATSSDFFTTADITAGDEDSTGVSQDAIADALNQFCEQSLALHGSGAAFSSPPQDSLDTSEVSITETSFETSASSLGNGAGPSTSVRAPPPVPPHLSDLEDIPPARHILALNPQTVTVNLIVGIISIAQPRTITTRWGRNMCLVEVLVGDETKSGFAITFWVPVDAIGRSNVSHLRNQDVVLMQNVALHVFRGKVYGQSLRRDMTKICLLWRRDGGGQYTTRDLAKRSSDAMSRDPQRAKTHAVKDWTLHFVGRQAAPRPKKNKKSWDEPPDDTQ